MTQSQKKLKLNKKRSKISQKIKNTRNNVLPENVTLLNGEHKPNV